ncbi:MAG: CGNR zinc finger domain-containing protein [Acidimicrobiia bacterium]
MDFSHYSDEPVRMAVALVNSVNVVTGEDQLQTPEDIETFLDAWDGDWFRGDWGLTDRDLHEVRALRSRLREVFTAANEREAAASLNALLEDVSATPRVSVHGEAPHLHFEPEGGSPARWLGTVAAMGLSTALIEGGFKRFGRCASTTCDDVFVDISRNRSRRHCSESCTTRESVAAYRRRRQERG